MWFGILLQLDKSHKRKDSQEKRLECHHKYVQVLWIQGHLRNQPPMITFHDEKRWGIFLNSQKIYCILIRLRKRYKIMLNNIKTRHASFHEITYPVIITVVMDCSIPIVDETIFTNFFSQCSVCALNKANTNIFYCLISISKFLEYQHSI